MDVQSVVQHVLSLRGWRLSLVVGLHICWVIAFLRPWTSSQAQNPVGHRPPSSTFVVPATATPIWQGYSIKPLAYVFPQFHPIPENDKFWGANFTEWVNVKKVTHNVYGQETLRPTEEVGYYNLLDHSTRARYAKLVRDSGFHGVVYHHYWFGRPVMEKVLEAMLNDGEPNVPFMLNWANEAWTARWDGLSNSGVLLAQDYGGISAWREHFDWMVPYFRHPNYIRANGKVQMMVYNPAAMGHMGKHMFAAWRRWAAEEGLGGMDIIETRIELDNPNSRGPADAINEFGFRSGGGHDSTAWVGIDRLSKVYHRGARVTWDNTPRHATDGGGTADIFAHPYLWKLSMIESMRRMKLEPNPRGEENFLVVNALNEWAEGNVLEPSIQWGDKYSTAFREAMDVVERLPWRDDMLEAGEVLAKEIESSTDNVDVCVLVQTPRTNWPWVDAFGIPEMLRSLQVQSNKRWRAVLVPTGKDVNREIMAKHVLDTFDPRVVLADVPEEIFDKPNSGTNNMNAVNWVIENIGKISPGCASASYFLVASSSVTYEPGTFNIISKSSSDIVGFNFVSGKTMEAAESSGLAWDQRCTRFMDGSTRLSRSMDPTSEIVDLGAAFINLRRWRSEGHTFGAHQDSTGGVAGLLRQLSTRPGGDAWTWAPARNGEGGGLVHGSTYTACIKTGHMWLDIPGAAAGCYSLISITDKFGWTVQPWDMARFKENPFCLRMSQEMYEKYKKGSR